MMSPIRYRVFGAAALLLAAVCLAGRLPAAASDQRTIVIDPGHGGLDVGAKGKFGSVEKDIDLAISKKLKALIEQNQTYRVVLTRDKDIDVSLENRAAIANNNDALVFLSIHVNASFRKKAQGSETFFMSLNATDEEARRLAYQENREAALDKTIAGADKDDIKMILLDMAQSAYIKQSGQLAELIQAQLNSLLGTENRGIKQADFVVLRGVACPAVLVEAAFISNPEEEQKLVGEGFQDNVAQAVYTGLMRFLAVYGKN
jgi:N-acetylmuramoyl-L-alanine amidase